MPGIAVMAVIGQTKVKVKFQGHARNHGRECRWFAVIGKTKTTPPRAAVPHELSKCQRATHAWLSIQEKTHDEAGD
jgi:hypothetical protein